MNFSAFNSASFNASGGTPLVLAYASLAGSASIPPILGSFFLFGTAAATATASTTSTSTRIVLPTALIDSSNSEVTSTALRIVEPTSTVTSGAEVTPVLGILMRLAFANIFSDMNLSVGSIANPTVLDPAWRVFTREANVTEFVRPADTVFRRVA